MSTDSLPPVLDEARALRAVPRRVVAAWAANDADAFADAFTGDARLILTGDVFLRGREEIRDFMRAGYAGPYQGSRVHGRPIDLRRITDDVALLVTVGGVVRAGETGVAPERAIRATWTLRRQDGGDWLISAYQDTPLAAG